MRRLKKRAKKYNNIAAIRTEHRRSMDMSVLLTVKATFYIDSQSFDMQNPADPNKTGSKNRYLSMDRKGKEKTLEKKNIRKKKKSIWHRLLNVVEQEHSMLF